jgi:hypothetical protein
MNCAQKHALRVLSLLAILTLSSCSSPTVTRATDPRPTGCDADLAPGDEGLRILFIGNSLSYWFDIPGILASLFELSEISFEEIEMVAEPNYGLPDHWVSGITQNTLLRGWDLVVMQQGPSATISDLGTQDRPTGL